MFILALRDAFFQAGSSLLPDKVLCCVADGCNPQNKFLFILCMSTVYCWRNRNLSSEDNVVSIASCFGLDRPGFESRWDKRLSLIWNRTDRRWGPPSMLFYGYWSSFRGVKWRGLLDHSPPSVTRSRMTGAIPLLPTRAFRAWRGTILPFCNK